MEYETVTVEARLSALNQAIAQQEQMHYQLVLEGIAQSANKNSLDGINAQKAIREKAITALQEERERERQVQAAAEQPANIGEGSQ